MQKVIVIGCPGAGKSTFARQLREEKAKWLNGRTDDLIAVTGDDVAAVAAERYLQAQ